LNELQNIYFSLTIKQAMVVRKSELGRTVFD
jgi:hypothetical protein